MEYAIENSKGEIIFKGEEEAVTQIKELFKETQYQLEKEGNLGKYDIDNLLEDCVLGTIFDIKTGCSSREELLEFNNSYELNLRG